MSAPSPVLTTEFEALLSVKEAPPGKQADLGLWGEGEGLRCPLDWKQWSLGQGMGENWRMPGRDKGLEGLDEHIQTAVV